MAGVEGVAGMNAEVGQSSSETPVNGAFLARKRGELRAERKLGNLAFSPSSQTASKLGKDWEVHELAL